MNRNFKRALPLVLKHEGGFVDHPDDPGNATNKGITIGTYRRYVNRNGTVHDLRRITDEQVANVYRKHYWNKVKADDLPGGVDYATFDFAVNSGPARAAKYLQAVVGAKQDGVVGPKTLAAVAKMDAAAIVNRLCDDRMAFLKRLKHWPTFRNGWTRRVSDVRTHAVEMAREDPTSKREPSPSVPLPGKAETPSAGKSGQNAGIAAVVAIVGGAIAMFWQWLAMLPCNVLGVMCG